MGICSRPVTWLDLAAGQPWGRDCSQLKLHSVSARCGDSECYVLSMSGRMLCSGDGRLTVFRTRDAVQRFLSLVHLEAPETVEHAGHLLDGGGRQHCLRLGNSSLCACKADAHAADCPSATQAAAPYLPPRVSASSSRAASC